MIDDRTTETTETSTGKVAGGQAAKPAEFVEALAKGLAILESFDAANPEMTLSEIARKVGYSPAAARRSLITLMALGYVGQTNKRFHLRPKIMTLSSGFYYSAQIDEVLQPHLREVVSKFGDASSVGTLDQRDVIYIAHNSVQRARRAAAVVGARYPACATSLGRVLLAGLSDAELDRYFDGLVIEPLTSKTMVDPVQLREEIEQVRKNGYSTTVDQLDYGITALAVPIRALDGRTIAALNTSGYSGMVDADFLVANRLPELRATASRIANALTRYPMLVSIIGS
ncbi:MULTISPECIES: IclR family transcriptional regulator domain-containing protein [Hoeflea]|jgi:IclR family pca regulon transcriptional regulator|uniref:Helix-turn-helix domain-containing protein n=1 Tax=Hoeflea alexandrii TaxID=288436 RepID=A0ABT1CWH5_9HYPH|nr:MULTISPECIES: IclR family transcriptional regulator C-terminal domain-containing protein [Hoeflea]MBV6650738.1 helix-turn-helix domain-containing protein [Hoeflea sp.]MCO6410569.1 helix-turn-helix domain-containing protein [Hoeflea alexandrii]MCY0152286.1 helix-turn-helix domain-containing protein [Hoeflea alexandrii]VVT23912.1 IclR family transcriptional regulator [Hoeflea sp. EC-HK425]